MWKMDTRDLMACDWWKKVAVLVELDGFIFKDLKITTWRRLTSCGRNILKISIYNIRQKSKEFVYVFVKLCRNSHIESFSELEIMKLNSVRLGIPFQSSIELCVRVSLKL